MAKNTCAKACDFSNDCLSPRKEYAIRIQGLLIEMARCDAAYLEENNLPPPFQKENLNGNRVNRFAKQCATIISEPDVFITLTFDASKWRNIGRVKYEEACKRFQKFTRDVMCAYPDAWFAWSMEISDEVKALHYHLVGSFSEKLSPKDITALARKWLYLTDSKNKKMFDLREADRTAVGYLFSPEKNAAKDWYARRFPNRRLFGILGKKNIEFAKSSGPFRIREKTKRKIESIIRESEYIAKGRETSHFDAYIKRERYSFSFYPKETVDRIRRLVKKRSL